MVDTRPEIYHKTFWNSLPKDVADKFTESGHNWDNLEPAERHVCMSADRYARKRAREDGYEM